MAKAILIGATGTTGSTLLQQLRADDRMDKVVVLGRSSTGVSHPKLTEHKADLFEMEDYAQHFEGMDMAFCCIGTTKSKTPDKEKYKKIDYGIPLAFAKVCKQKNIDKLVVISAMGANPDSSIFYNRIKGEMERDVLAVGVANTYVVQPSLINGDRDESRFFESLGIRIFGALKFLFVGPLKKYRMIDTSTLAAAMKKIAFEGSKDSKISNDRLLELGND